MEKAFQKLENFLNEIAQTIVLTVLKDSKLNIEMIDSISSMEEAKKLLQPKFLEAYKEYLSVKKFRSFIKKLENNEHKIIIKKNELVDISYILLESPLKNRERVYIMLKLIEKNITCIEEHNQWVKIHNEFAELHNMFLDKRNKQKNVITSIIDKAKKFDDTKIEFLENSELIELEKQNTILKKHYFDKLGNYNMEDIEEFIKVLKELELEPSICEGIKSIMIKNLEKRKEKDKVVISSNFKSVNIKKETELTTKESKQLYYELKTKYFDLESMTSVRYLSVPEKIKVTVLLKQLNYSEEELEKILCIIDNNNRKYSDTVDLVIKYADIMYRSAYYKDELQLENYIQKTDEYLNEWLNSSKEESLTWEEFLKEELEKLNDLLPRTHEYEQEQTKKAIILAKR